MCWNRVVWFITISARARSCLSIVARDVQLCEILLWRTTTATQRMRPRHTTRDFMSCITWYHVVKCIMSCLKVHDALHLCALFHLMQCTMPWQSTCTPWHARRDVWCNCVMRCHTAHEVTQTNIIKHVFCTHEGFCIEQTTVSWRTRIYAKNCNKCGKTLKIANNVDKHSYILPC